MHLSGGANHPHHYRRPAAGDPPRLADRARERERIRLVCGPPAPTTPAASPRPVMSSAPAASPGVGKDPPRPAGSSRPVLERPHGGHGQRPPPGGPDLRPAHLYRGRHPDRHRHGPVRGPAQPVGAVLLSRLLAPHTSTCSYNHFSLLRTYEDLFGIKVHLCQASVADPITADLTAASHPCWAPAASPTALRTCGGRPPRRGGPPPGPVARPAGRRGPRRRARP